MKPTYFFIALTFFYFTTLFSSHAQELPRPSPYATVKQTVGLTDITIDYSSPGVKGREIWGKLVPYGELWRTGANKATKITFSKDVTINGENVPAGSYSLFTIPGKDEWTVILNKETELWGTGGYKEENDLMRFNVKPETSSMMWERLHFVFTDFTDSEATVNLFWKKLNLPFKVMVNTDEQALENIKSTLKDAWRPYANAARYYLENGKSLDEALQYIDKSISISNEWFNNWLKAEILHAKKDNKEALKYAQTAKELGDKSANFFYKSKVEAALKEWKK